MISIDRGVCLSLTPLSLGHIADRSLHSFTRGIYTGVRVLTDDLRPQHALELHGREKEGGVLEAEAENASEGQVSPRFLLWPLHALVVPPFPILLVPSRLALALPAAFLFFRETFRGVDGV